MAILKVHHIKHINPPGYVTTITKSESMENAKLTQASRKDFPPFGHVDPDNEVIRFSSAHSIHQAFSHSRKYLLHSLQ
jgi:hypothetical protein